VAGDRDRRVGGRRRRPRVLRHGCEHRDALVVPPLDRVVRVSDVLHRAAAELHRSETGELASGVSFNTAVSVFGEIPESLAEYWKEEGDLVVRPWNAGGIVADSDRGEP